MEEIWFLKLEVSLQPDNLNIDLRHILCSMSYFSAI
jgi:hypothetical protein